MTDVANAFVWGSIAAGLLTAGIYFGSRGFKDFDTALIPYAGGSVLAAFGLGYRYAMWLRRPPTRLYWRRGWQTFLDPRRLAGNLVHLLGLFWRNFIAQSFIERRSPLRWAAHACLFWGCILAAAVTFPLSFGWIRFETPPNSQDSYIAYVFGVRLFEFPLDGIAAMLIFNVLVISAVLVLAGVFLALWRRVRDRGALAVQQFANDLVPLILLFAISITGLLLTVSARFLHGFHYGFLSQLHAATVILTLLYLPFGKFFHIFQRPAQLGFKFYRRAAAEGEPARCIRCGEIFGCGLHISDLKRVEAELGIRYELETGSHYQDVCPPCRRKNLALVQDRLWRDARQGE
ncbi:MAG: MFS transporter [Planctomycetes bacterium]|nr:MFS transporter [Planctomycetota bacterium]